MNTRALIRRVLVRAVLAAAPAFVAGSGLAGCKIGERAYWAPGEGGAGGASPAGGAPSCEDDCAMPPEGWSPPALFGVGPFAEVPACPDEAPFPGIDVFSGLQAAPQLCPVCQCGPSGTACSVPASWVVSAADCAGAASAEATPFDAPAGWDGGCATGGDGGIPAGVQCGGVPCVQSLTVEAPLAMAGACEPQAVGRSYAPPPGWARRARECLPVQAGACPERPGTCFPPAGFSLCVRRGGDVDCPESYPKKEVFHREVEDARACAPCECGEPEGNACTVLASAFQDAACGAPAGALLVTSETGDGCVDVPPGLALGGKTAEVVTAADGACTPNGGEPVGSVVPAQPVTVCCRQELVPK